MTADETAAWVRQRDLDIARWDLEQAEAAFAHGCAHLGRVNRETAKEADYRPPAWKRTAMRRDAFATLNRYRGRLVRARKALAALLAVAS